MGGRSNRRACPRAREAGVAPNMTADLDFIAALIDTVAARYAVDSTRVYLSGFSNGGGMAFGVSCRMPSSSCSTDSFSLLG